MMPVPRHLQGLVRPKSPVVDEAPLDAEVVCACGSKLFSLWYPGATRMSQGERIPVVAVMEERACFLIKAHCIKCARESLLFDMDFHGWNGFVCHNKKDASLPRHPLTPWKCLNCGKGEHQASVQVHSQGREDFIQECGDDFDEDRWPDGFGWFSMSIGCDSCGKVTTEWISYETM